MSFGLTLKNIVLFLVLVGNSLSSVLRYWVIFCMWDC